MIVAIHQPNFFPWLGFFRKIKLSDIFVFLDGVSFNRRSWQHRVKLLINGRASWVGCHLHRVPSGTLISELEFSETRDWRRKMINQLRSNYCGTRFFNDYKECVEAMIMLPEKRLAAFNVANIKTLCRLLNLKTQFIMQSEMESVFDANYSGSQRNAAICGKLDADCYLSGDGAGEYERKIPYDQADIELRHSNFTLKPYTQYVTAEFVPGLSVLDAIFNLGASKTSSLLDY